MISIVVADDEELVRDGLTSIVDSHPEFEVVATAANGVEAVAAVASAQPDVVLMDIRMPLMDGIEAARRIVAAQGATKILVLTTIEVDEVVYSALRAGASGFLLKSVTREQLWRGIEAVASGDALLAPSLTRRLIEDRIAAGPPPQPASLGLTQRQSGLVRLVARGLSNQEIAAELHLAETTVKGYVSDVLALLGLRDRTQLVVVAYESGLVRVGDR